MIELVVSLPYALALCLACVLGRVFYSLYFDPLSPIKAASFLVTISRLLWTLPSEVRGRITIDLPQLHEKHGSLIRLGPNEVSFYSLDIYKTVHSIRSPFTKDPRVYGQFVQDAHPALFSITDPQEHSQRRRLMGQIFNLSKMDAQEEMMLDNISNFIGAIYQRGPVSIETVQACRALEADIVSSFGFGEDIGAIASWARGNPLEMIKANDEKSKVIALMSTFPNLSSLWDSIQSCIFTITGWQSISTAAIKEFDEWATHQLTRLTTNQKSRSSSHPNFITTMVNSRLPAPLALSEAKEMLGPGTDTTSVTLAHILWALAHDHRYQLDLVRDLEAAAWPTDMSSLENIPRLRAAIREGVRWTGAATAMLPRVVPDGGANLEGVFIPGGTIISSSPVWYLHDKIAYPSPKNFRPSRWLNYETKTPEEIKLQEEFYIPFSKGSAACIGAHFANFELLLSLSQILKAFHLSLPDVSHVREAVLPERLEWVAAVLCVDLDVHFVARKSATQGMI